MEIKTLWLVIFLCSVTVIATTTTTLETDFILAEGWAYEGKLIDEPYLYDITIVELDDGRYRLYGEKNDEGAIVISYVSTDGLIFQREAGYRLSSGFLPFVVKLPDGRFRLYYTDQASPVGQADGYRAILSAISPDGLNFTLEEGERLVYSGDNYEISGIRGAKILNLTDGTSRMYYHGIGDNAYRRVLSAISSDGLNWTRESGVRIDPDDLCTGISHIGNTAPLIYDNTYHLYVSTSLCGGGDFANGIADLTSTDGLTFTTTDEAVVEGYTTQSNEVNPEDPAAILTDQGIRLYFAPYGTQGAVVSESGVYSLIFSTATTTGDINFDGQVNIIDLAMLGIAWGSSSGDANWNANADLNNDGSVSLLDLAILGQNWG